MPLPDSPVVRKLLLGLATFVLLAGLVWINRHTLVETVLKPWLQERAEQALDGQLRWQTAQIAWNRISLHELDLNVAGQFAGRIDRLQCDFAWPDVLFGTLAKVTLVRPVLNLTLEERKGDSPAAAPDIPPNPPLTIEDWQVEQGRLQISWPGGKLLVTALHGSGRLAEQLSFNLAGHLADEQKSALLVAGTGRWRQGLELSLRDLRWREQSLLPEPLTVQPASLAGLHGRLALERLISAEVDSLLTGIGQSTPWPKTVTWTVDHPALEFRLLEEGPRFELTTGGGRLVLDDHELNWTAGAAEVRQPAGQSWRGKGELHFGAAGQLLVSGQLQEAVFSGRLELPVVEPRKFLRRLGMPRLEPLKILREFQLVADLRASPDRVELSAGRLTGQVDQLGQLSGKFAGHWREGDWAAELGPLDLGEGLARVAVGLDERGSRAARTGHLRVDCSDTRPFLRALGAKSSEGLPVLTELALQSDFRWQGQAVVLTNTQLRAAVAAERTTGTLAVEGAGAWQHQAGFRLAVEQASLSGIEFSNGAGTVVLAGGRIDAAGTVEQDAADWRFSLRGQAGTDEALVKSWYAELRDLPVRYEVAGEVRSKTAQVALEKAEFTLGDWLSARLEGQLSVSQGSLSGHVEVGPLAGDFEQTLHRLAGDLLPAVRDLGLVGRLAIVSHLVYRQDSWDLGLRFLPRDLSVTWKDAWRLENLQGEMPLLLRHPFDAEPSAPAREGRLTWQAVRGPWLLEAGPGGLAGEAKPNFLDLTQPVEFQLADGSLRLKKLAAILRSGEPELETTVELVGVDLAVLTRQLGWPEMTGRLSAELNDVHLDREVIRTDGEASVQVFGGELKARNLRIEKPLSRYPTYYADIDFSGIDLAALTHTFAFGEINGIADGYVHDLRLFNRLPSSFRGRFETRGKGTRNISVKAIRNLNALSQGGLSAALSQGIYQFIDFYHYRKIGLLCTLQNDLFHIEGTAKPGSDKYLVYGSWLPPKIDVIISSPTISFEEMVKRLKRVERTGR